MHNYTVVLTFFMVQKNMLILNTVYCIVLEKKTSVMYPDDKHCVCEMIV